MNKLPENSDQTKNVKKSPSITRIATRRIINIFVPLMETRLITNSVQHMLKQQKSRLEKFRQVNNKKAQLCLSWEENSAGQPYVSRRSGSPFPSAQNSMAVMLLESAGHRFIPQRYALCRLLITFDDTGTRHQHSYVDTVRRRSLCFQSTDCYIPPLAVA